MAARVHSLVENTHDQKLALVPSIKSQMATSLYEAQVQRHPFQRATTGGLLHKPADGRGYIRQIGIRTGLTPMLDGKPPDLLQISVGSFREPQSARDR
jgi:hypothetical protein